MKNMVDDFRDYARIPPPQLEGLDLNRLVAEVLALYEQVRNPYPGQPPESIPLVRGDPDRLRQVIHNLLQNAQDALSGSSDRKPQPLSLIAARPARRKAPWTLHFGSLLPESASPGRSGSDCGSPAADDPGSPRTSGMSSGGCLDTGSGLLVQREHLRDSRFRSRPSSCGGGVRA